MTPHLAMNRLAFGPSSFDLDQFRKTDLQAWVEAQLQPSRLSTSNLNRKLADARLRIKYGAKPGSWGAIDEMRPLNALAMGAESLAELVTPGIPINGLERDRPRQELMAATLIRAVYSPAQLEEVLVDFWHNHFSVNGLDRRIAYLLPVYDREVIRPNALGNFRQLLEAVAQSGCMLTYLNNKSSRAGAPNENYARELFELHTLGRDAYLNNLYDKWRDVPGADSGKPVGYIDQDIYEAARAFTGWTLQESPEKPMNPAVPIRRGVYVYVPSLHDNYQKRILATEFQPFASNEADGRAVLDLVAFHPATAANLCRRLCVRLLGTNAPDSLVASAAEVWARNRNDPAQIAKVVRHIALSAEFSALPAQKAKRPLEAFASFVRFTGIDFTVTEGFLRQFEQSGQRLFGWPSPDGHPESDSFWTGMNVMRRRWALFDGLLNNAWGTGVFDPFAPWSGRPVRVSEFLTLWCERALGRVEPRLLASMVQAAGLATNAMLGNPAQARMLVLWFGISPAFQLR